MALEQVCRRRHSIGSWLCGSSLQSSVWVPKSSEESPASSRLFRPWPLCFPVWKQSSNQKLRYQLWIWTLTHMPCSVSLWVACQSCSTSSVLRQGQVCSVLLDSLGKHVVKHASERDGARKNKMQNETTMTTKILCAAPTGSPWSLFQKQQGVLYSCVLTTESKWRRPRL